MSAGGYVRRGFCPQGVLFRGLCPQGVLSAGGYVLDSTQTGVVPKIINICLVVQHININIQTHTCMTTFPHHTIPAHDRRIYTTYSSNMDQKRGERELYDKLPRLSISFDIVCFNLMIE